MKTSLGFIGTFLMFNYNDNVVPVKMEALDLCASEN